MTEHDKSDKGEQEAAGKEAGDPHEKARELAEDALGAYAEGDKSKGDELAEHAARIDRSAVEEVVRDLDEDAASDHSADGT